MPIVDELIEVAVKHGAGKKQDYASDMTIADVFRRFAEKMSEGSGEDSGGSGGVLMVTDTGGTLDKTMGEIQDAYFAGKRVIISAGVETFDVIGMVPVMLAKSEYEGTIKTYDSALISSKFTLVAKGYFAFGETEEAARNAYPRKEVDS